MKNNHPVGISFDDRLIEKAREVAKARRLSLSAFVSEALEKHIRFVLAKRPASRYHFE